MNAKTTIIDTASLRQQRAYCEKIQAWWAETGRSPTAFVDTYGCQQNEADSERIRGLLQACGYVFQEEAEGADVIVINTCAVREHAEQRVFGNVGALVHDYRRHPDQIIVLCGCMMTEPSVAKKIWASYSHVRGVFSTHHLWRFPELLYQTLTTGKRVFFTEASAGTLAEGLPMARKSKIKAWLSVMYGCNKFCSYCIVPYVRGRERSRKPEDVLAEAKGLVDAGYRDITLLGQNVNSYGRDLSCGVDFSDILAEIAAMDGEFLLRFMTSHPKDASRKLFDTMAAAPKIAKHIHLPFQSGSDRVLAAMKRGYTVGRYLELVEYARSVMPDLVLTSDVIVGFPGETEAEFEETMRLIEDVRFDALFTFIYSPRLGTPAASLPDPNTHADKVLRLSRLTEVQNKISRQTLESLAGQTRLCLVDGVDGERLTARTDGNRLVRVSGADASYIGQFRWITITGSTTWSFTGELADETGQKR